MAKKRKRGVNKSKAVREYLEDHPNATAVEVVPALAQQGIKVSGALVNNVRSVLKKQGQLGAKTTSGGGRGKGMARQAARKVQPHELSIAELKDAKKLVDELGGLEQARKALDTLEELR